MEYHKAGLWPDACARQDLPERRASPFADAAPALDAIMSGDLGARGQDAQLLERQRQFVLDDAVDRQAPIGEMIVDEMEVFLVLRVSRAIGPKRRRDVCLIIFRREPISP